MKKILVLACLLAGSAVFAATDDFENHLLTASNQKLNMNSRWSSLLAAAELADHDQLDEIKKFSSDKEWYMRNAALVALNKVNRDAAIIEARKLLSDKSLVVRSAAVEVVAQRMNLENKKALIEEIDKAYNFHKKSSLWIRLQILEKVAEVAGSSEREIFVKTLFDSDPKIATLSAATLEKITGKKLEGKKFVESWKSYVADKKWM